MHKPLIVIDVVGLTHDMLGPHTPHISRLAQDGFARAILAREQLEISH